MEDITEINDIEEIEEIEEIDPGDDELESDVLIDVKKRREPTDIDSNCPTITHLTLTNYEKTSLIGLRAQQISEGALSFLPFEEAKKLMNPLLIAEDEFKRGYIIYDIVRNIPFGSKTVEMKMKVIENILLTKVGNLI